MTYNYLCSQLLKNNRQIATIKKRVMSAKEYRLAVDVGYSDNKPQEVVIIFYKPELERYPKVMDTSEFMNRGVDSLIEGLK